MIDLINKHVIIRTYSAGVHFGILDKVEESDNNFSVKLTDSYRIWKWSGANSLNELAVSGCEDKNTFISIKVPSIYLKAIEIIEMTDKSIKNLKSNEKQWTYNK